MTKGRKWFWVGVATVCLSVVGLVIGVLTGYSEPLYYGSLLIGFFVLMGLAAHHRRGLRR